MSISTKLFISLLLCCLIATSGMLLFVRWNLATGMDTFIFAKQQQRIQPLLNELANYYRTHLDWKSAHLNRADIVQLIQKNIDSNQGDFPGPHAPGMNNFPFPPRGRPGDEFFPGGMLILDAKRHIVLNTYPPHLAPKANSTNIQLFPIIDAAGIAPKTVGWIGLPKQPPVTEVYERVFFEHLRKTLWLSAVGALLLAGVFAGLLARNFTKPLHNIKKRIEQLAEGHYQPTDALLEQRSDELGILSRDIEDLRLSLANTDSARKRWLADTSHELRTPLTIARAEAEAMLDGIHQIESKNIQTIHEEIINLQTLIEDLGVLANSDIGSLSYRKKFFDISSLCEECIAHSTALLNSQKLTLTANIQPHCHFWGDMDRIAQLIKNLLSNSLKYTDEGGEILFSLHQTGDHLNLIIEDSAPEVTDAQLPLIFDHLYRADSSRNRKTGGSGLGLAIVKRICEAHHGHITAEKSHLGGLKISMTLLSQTLEEKHSLG